MRRPALLAPAPPRKGFSAALVSVRLPGSFRHHAGGDRDAARRLAARLIAKHRITAGVMVLDGGLWLHVSAQIYNEIGDYAGLAEIGKALGGKALLG